MRNEVKAGIIVVIAALGGAACAHNRGASVQPVHPKPDGQPAPDLISQKITEAEGHLARGLAEMKEGHLNGAREAFDRSLDVYLTAPGGAYSSTRLADAYRRTVQIIHLQEIEALAAGDGFVETPAEPAAIDEVGGLAVAEAAPSEQTRRTTEEVVKEEANDLPIVLNDAVLSCVDLYQGRLREWFTAALQRGGRYVEKIRTVFASEGIPRDLAYVALVESAFKTGALSRARARGVWQFMPSTGKRFGLAQDWWVDERSDPEKATRAAAKYLKALYEMFGDWNLALAGYNAGEGKIRRGLGRYKAQDFWELARTRGLKRETKNYVPLIHAAIIVAKAPDKYGFEITPESPLAFETVPIDGAVDLRMLAECAGATVPEVQELNPELRRLATPANKTFSLRVPEGAAEAVRTCLADLPPEKRVLFRTHVVARGQTLGAIASRYGARSRDIAEANGLSPRKRLRTGTELIIPIDPGPAVRRAARETRPASSASAGRGPTPDSSGMRITYRIKPGDTLQAIASHYGTTVQNLRSWNRLRGTRIAAGEVLTIYTNRKF